jgi:hypothetical protein
MILIEIGDDISQFGDAEKTGFLDGIMNRQQ